ncbi:MAG TPA: hypothetical protein PKC43_12845 [Phycisphaerales bacterium]|nr:hypothetical protein [Phycisphaerales bacterium]HMP38321.1 hypothetical protein [Phycisphaerales bacterium]
MSPTITCRACGCEAIVERRLRTTEPELPGTPLRSRFGDESEPGAAPGTGAGRWIRSSQFRQGDVAAVACPGCGVTMALAEENDAVEVLRCDSCGTDARYERRIVARPRDPSEIAPAPRPRSPDEPPNLDDRAEDDPETEHLCWRLVTERDDALRTALALNLRRWRFVNRTSARFAPALIDRMHAAPRSPLFERALADGLSLLLNHDDHRLRDAVLIGSERHLFRPGASRPLISALGLGPPIGLKLLLDGAEWAERHGDHEQAAACLNAVNWIFQRNHGAHASMGEVLLYRLLYLSGPVLAFGLGVAQRRITGTGFHFDPETLLRFVDDAAAERPALVPELVRAYYGGPPANGAALRERIAFFRSIGSLPARRLALSQHLRPAASDPAADALHHPACAELVRLVEESLFPDELRPAADADDGGAISRQAGSVDPATSPRSEGAALTDAACACLRGLLAECAAIPPALEDLVARRGDELPAEFRRAYVALVPSTPRIDRAAIPPWSSPAAETQADAIAEAWAMWRRALAAVVDDDAELRDRLREFWSERASSPEAAAAPVR